MKSISLLLRDLGFPITTVHSYNVYYRRRISIGRRELLSLGVPKEGVREEKADVKGVQKAFTEEEEGEIRGRTECQ